MNKPAKQGAIVYANDIKALATFYTELFSMQATRTTTEFVSLVKDGFNIVIHVPPATMPRPDFNSVKLFLTVDSLAAAKAKTQQLGGQVFAGEWSNPVFTVCNIADPDGNHIQLREFA